MISFRQSELNQTGETLIIIIINDREIFFVPNTKLFVSLKCAF